MDKIIDEILNEPVPDIQIEVPQLEPQPQQPMKLTPSQQSLQDRLIKLTKQREAAALKKQENNGDDSSSDDDNSSEGSESNHSSAVISRLAVDTQNSPLSKPISPNGKNSRINFFNPSDANESPGRGQDLKQSPSGVATVVSRSSVGPEVALDRSRAGSERGSRVGSDRGSEKGRGEANDDFEYEEVDMLAYMLDWEKAMQNSKSTQCGHFDTVDVGTQFNGDNSAIASADRNKGVQVAEGDFEAPVEYYLESLFKGFAARSKRFFPKNNLEIMSADRFNKVKSSKLRRYVNL